MSDLQRNFAKAKLASLPAFLPDTFDEEEEEEVANSVPDLSGEHLDDDSSSASSASSTGTIRPTISNQLFSRPMGAPSRKYSQIPWITYFERELKLSHTTSNSTVTHQVYLTSPVGNGPLFVGHHGAGSSGLTFALLASEIRKIHPSAGFLSLDARDHGLTTALSITNPLEVAPLDVSLPTLASDLVTVIQATRDAMSWPTLPPLILIGHSLGGAVVCDVARNGQLGTSLLGYAVLDIVEKTAIDSLASMTSFLSTRPQGFPSLEAGIEWHVRGGTVRNATSARVSVPALLRWQDGQSPELKGRWVWRTDLGATQPFWEEWFVGLSKKFLEARGGKLLLLAGTDRLDKDMMIGQMQGKYALQVFPDSGHFLHEDQPNKAAMAIVDFYKRNDRSALVLPPKVSDMLRAGKRV